MTAAPPLLAIHGLVVRFGGLTAVDNVSLDVQEGRIISLIGPNGAGKTTVFNAVTALHPFHAGEIHFAGLPVSATLDIRTGLRMAGVALACAVAFQIGYDVENLWQAAIVAHYRYQQPFPWTAAVASAWSHLVHLGVWPAIIGAVIGGAGAFNVWRGAKRTPELVFSRGIARTFQNIRLFKEMTCRENLLVAMASARRWRWANPFATALRLPAFRRGERQAADSALEQLRFVGLAEVADLPAGSLPYGSQRRLEIARALAGEPRLLLLDEPAAGMNPSESAALMQLIRAIHGRGVTVLLIEHDMSVVMGISDRVVVLEYGRIIADGTPSEIRTNPRVIEAYLGKETPAQDGTVVQAEQP